MVEELIKYFGGGVLILIAAGYLVKIIITHSLTKEVETQRAILSKDIETHRAILSTQTLRLSRLHEKRLFILEQLYSNLDDLIKAVGSLVDIFGRLDDPHIKDKRNKANEALREFRDHYDKKRIFFSEDLCEKIDEFIRNLLDLPLTFDSFLSIEEECPDEGLSKEARKAWGDAFKHMRDWTPIAKQAIENEFRAVLGSQVSTTDEVVDKDDAGGM